MIELLGELYYIDFGVLESFLLLDKNNKGKVELKQETLFYDENDTLVSRELQTTENIKHKEIDGVRFELIRGFINDLGDDTEGDPAMGGSNLIKMSIRFKLAFNTLVAYDILKKIED